MHLLSSDAATEYEWRSAAVVGLGDLLVIALLVLVGRVDHGYPVLGDPLGSLESIVPFVIGWVLVSALTGIYASQALRGPRVAAVVTTVTWLAAVNVGFILRSSPAFDGGAAWPFTLIMTVTGLAALVAWRVVFSIVR